MSRSDYIPKSKGDTLLRYKIARANSVVNKAEKNGIKSVAPMVDLSVEDAILILQKSEKIDKHIYTIEQLAGEISDRLDAPESEVDIRCLRNLSYRLVARIADLK